MRARARVCVCVCAGSETSETNEGERQAVRGKLIPLVYMYVALQPELIRPKQRNNDIQHVNTLVDYVCIWVILQKTGQNCDIEGKNSK